jgi:hypothetical protein
MLTSDARLAERTPEILAPAAYRSRVEPWTLTAAARWVGRVRVHDKKAYGASAAAYRRLAGALQESNAAPVRSEVGNSSRATWASRSLAARGSVMGLRPQTALAVGVRRRAAPPARRQGAAAPDDRIVGTEGRARSDRPLARRRAGRSRSRTRGTA